MSNRNTLASGARHVAVALLCLLGAALASAQTDPPGRVAHLSHLEGHASFALEGSGAWSPAEFNRPLTSGDQVATDPGSRAELHSGSTALRLDGRTRLIFTTLNDDTTRLQLAGGTLALQIRALYPGERYEINTANLAFVASQPGEYRFDVDLARGTTRVTLHRGSGVAYGEGGETRSLAAPQQMIFLGRQLGLMQVLAAAPRDAFDLWVAARTRLEDRSRSARYLSRETPGYQQLDAYGDWSSDPFYGPIWYPRVTLVDWAPYRYGQWRWIAPWGWTWIDDAPWGFAPCHYGRWTQVGARWAWVPGPLTPRPIFAPALVGFIGIAGSSGGVNWSISIGSGGAGIAWFPLAPGEVWRPAYAASSRYLEQINRGPHRRDERIPATDYRFRQHAAALTAMPAEDFGQHRTGRPGAVQRVPESVLPHTQVLPPPPRTGYRGESGARFAPGAPAGSATQTAPAVPRPMMPATPPAETRQPPRIDSASPIEQPRGRDLGRPAEPQTAQPPRREEPVRRQEEPSRPMPRQLQQAPIRNETPAAVPPPQIQRVEPPVQRMEPPVQRVEPPVQRSEPPVRRVEPPVQRAEPPVQRIEPPVRRMEPPVQRVEPPAPRIEPPIRRVEPPVQRAEPPVQRMEPPAQRVEPPPAQRVEPPVQRSEPPIRRVEPPVQRAEPPVQRMEPPAQRVEPPPASRRPPQIEQRPEPVRPPVAQEPGRPQRPKRAEGRGPHQENPGRPQEPEGRRER